MLNTLINELKDLTQPLDFICEEHAMRATNAICNIVSQELNAYIVDIYYRKHARGGIILEPFAEKRGHNVDPAASIIVNKDKGILPWVYTYKRVAWIDEVQAKDWTKPVLNLAAVDGIKLEKQFDGVDYNLNEEKEKYIQPNPKLQSFYRDTNAIIAVPLNYRNIIWGVLSVEFTYAKPYEKELLTQLTTLARRISSLIWKADVQKENSKETSDAVDQFTNAIENLVIGGVELTPFPSAFYSMQFDKDGKFEKIQSKINHMLPEVQVNHYEDLGEGHVIEEIMKMIKSSHFCIADITSVSPNVMIELGMILMNEKPVIILKEASDNSEIPFSINQRNVYKYKLEGEKLKVKNKAGKGFVSFKKILEDLAKKYIRIQ